MIRPRNFALAFTIFMAIEICLITFVDRPLSDWARNLDATHPVIINFFRAITDFGKSKWYLWPSGIAIVMCCSWLHLGTAHPERRQQIARCGHTLLFAFLSIALSGIITDIIKPILGRARPVEWAREGMYDFHPLTFQAAWNGMPSGHATTAAALTAVMVVLFPRGRIVWCVYGIILAASRIMVNAHYLSDVFAGIGVGLLTTLLFVRLRNHHGMFPPAKGIFPIDKPSSIS